MIMQADRDAVDGGVIELVPSLDANELDVRLRRADRRTDVGHRELAFYLAEMHGRGLHQQLGYASTVEYACKRLEMGRRHAQELLVVGRALEDLELIDEAFCAGRLRWSRIRLLVRVATSEHERAWLDQALTLPWTAFDRLVATSEKGRAPRSDRKGLPQVKMTIRGRVSRLAYETWETARKKLGEERGEPVSDADCMAHAAALILTAPPAGAAPVGDVPADSPYRVVLQRCPDCEASAIRTPEGLEEVARPTADAIACDAPTETVDGDVDDEGKTPAALRRRVLVRDGLACRACSSRQQLMAHHIVWRSRHGKTTASNLVTLCARCHGLVHEDLLLIDGVAPNGVRFSDRRGHAIGVAGAILGSTLRRLRVEAQVDVRAADGSSPDAGGVSPAESGALGGGSIGVGAPSALPCSPLDPPELTLAGVPSQVDLAWWARHRHLFSWSDRAGEMAFRPGVPLDPADAAAARSCARGEDAQCGSGSDAAPCAAPSHRPRRLAEVIGQQAAVHVLSTAAKAAKVRRLAVDHVLMLGPAGLGKTTLAQALAHEIGTRAHSGSGALIQDPGALLRLLTGIRERDVVFLDEIHALPRRALESLYEAMEDFRLSLTVSDGRLSKAIRIDLPRFTLVGATTEIGRLPEPFVSRFPIREHLSEYAEADLSAIVSRAAAREGVGIEGDAARGLAKVARGTARQALGLFRRVLAEAIAAGRDAIDLPAVERALRAAGIDRDGLNPLERRALGALEHHGRPMGLARWAAASGLPASTLRQLCEPELLRLGMVTVTPRGRMARAQLRAQLTCGEPGPMICRDRPNISRSA